jgi:hypothetical protein
MRIRSFGVVKVARKVLRGFFFQHQFSSPRDALGRAPRHMQYVELATTVHGLVDWPTRAAASNRNSSLSVHDSFCP